MRYQHRVVEVEADQFQPDRLPWPTGVGANVGGGWSIRTDDYSHESVHPGDYIVWDESRRERREPGEPLYPCVMSQDAFKSRYVLAWRT